MGIFYEPLPLRVPPGILVRLLIGGSSRADTWHTWRNLCLRYGEEWDLVVRLPEPA